jgi:putative ABC transport system permease protein
VRVFSKQLVSVLAMYLRDAPFRSGAIMVSLVGSAGTAFILVSVLALANGVSHVVHGAGVGADNILLVTQLDAPLEMSSNLPDAEAGRIIGWVRGLTDDQTIVSPETVSLMDSLSRGGEAGAQLPGRGVGPAGPGLREDFRVTSGRMFTPGEFEVIVGRGLARDFGGLAIGDSVTGGAREWRIVGEFAAGGGPAESEIWMDLGKC